MDKTQTADMEDAAEYAELLRAKIRVRERLSVSAVLAGRPDPWQVKESKEHGNP